MVGVGAQIGTMAGVQKLSIPFLVRSLQQSSSVCRKTLLLKSDTASLSSSLFLSTSALRPRKPQFISFRPSRGVLPVFSSLPTSNPEWASGEIVPKWSARAIKSFTMAEMEARRMRYPKIGTECLLMGILTEGTSNAAKFLRGNGVNLFALRDEVISLLGRSDLRYMTPLLDVPLTEPSQKALDWAVGEKIKSGESGELTTTDMLLAIWAQKGSAGQRVLDAFGFDDKKFKELESMKDEVVGSPKRKITLPAISI